MTRADTTTWGLIVTDTRTDMPLSLSSITDDDVMVDLTNDVERDQAGKVKEW